jgi:AcrR family transcriptional regulator
MAEDTKQNIINAAIIIFNEDLSAPLEKVADQANVTRRTLNRYFHSREELFVSCNQEMQKSCSKAMKLAEESSDDPLVQLEQWLYAAIDCGVKYAFLYKLHHMHGHEHVRKDKDCAKYDRTFDKILAILEKLQAKGPINKLLTIEWIEVFLSGIVTATINSHASGNVDKASLKKFAWYSFSKGIGV